MKLDDRDVPAAAIGHWKQALGRLPDAALAAIAKAHPKLETGFRPGKVPGAQLRQRAQAMLDTASGLPDTLHEALAAEGLQGNLVCVLSHQALKHHPQAWADAFGPTAIASAMLLDDRAPVRQLGFQQLDALGGQEPDEHAVQQAQDALVEAFRPFLRHLKPLVDRLDGDVDTATPQAAEARPRANTSGGTATREPGPATAPVRSPRPTRERELVIELRAQRQQARQAQRLHQAAERECAELTAQRDAATAARDQAREALRRVQAELTATRDRIDQLVRDGVTAQLDERLRPWLAPAEALQRDVAALTEGTLLDEAQTLLQRQAEIDRREGLRSQLKAELERTRAALAEVQRAQVEALNPLPQLRPMAQRLQAHAQALQARLEGAAKVAPQVGMPVPASSTTPTAAETATPAHDAAPPAAARLRQAIAAADTLDALATLRRQVHAAEPLGLLTPQELAHTHALLHDAASRLYDRAGLHGGRADTLPAALSDPHAFPLHTLLATLARGQPAILVVDGHNVMHWLPGLFRPDQDDHPRARRALADKLLALAARHPTLRIELWFDGPAHDTQTLSDQVRQHFSGGTGPDRADHAIVAQVRHLASFADKPDFAEGFIPPIAVVSADGQVRADVTALGALVVLPRELGVWWRTRHHWTGSYSPGQVYGKY